MPLDLDFTSAPEPGQGGGRADFNDPLDPDWYTVRVREAEETDTSKVSPSFNLLFEIESGQDTGDKWRGRWIRDTIWATEKSMGWLREKLEAMGVDTSTGKLSLNANQLVGRRVAVLTRWQERRNDPTKFEAKVRAYDKVADSGLHTDWRDQVAAPAGSGGEQDDGIPFACSKV